MEHLNLDHVKIDYQKAFNTHRLHNSIQAGNKEDEKNHHIYVKNYCTWGSVKVKSFLNAEFTYSSISKTNIHKIYNWFKIRIDLCLMANIKAFEIGGSYYSTAICGLILKVDSDNNLLEVDEKLELEELKKVLIYVQDNLKIKINTSKYEAKNNTSL